MMNRDEKRRLVLLIICIAVAAGVAVLFVSSGTAGMDAEQARDYIAQHHVEDTTAQNAVTAVYLNYRYWDTLFEALILLVSVLAVISLSWSGVRRR
jgi:multicomponent Na+:H+ antiporter subunit B